MASFTRVCQPLSLALRGGHLEWLVFGATLAQGAKLGNHLGRKEFAGGQGAG